jgi:hypothetical protein
VLCQFFFPSLSFYCATHHLNRLELLDQRYYDGPCDVCIYDRLHPLANKKLTPIFESDTSGVVISVVDDGRNQVAAKNGADPTNY